jgi:beta-lactam-binding protein with PASTA domain
LTVGSFVLTDEAPENTVISQDPAAGGRVARGTRVTVTVATQRLTVFVPDLRLRTEPELVSILMDNGLVPGVRSETNDPDVPATLVLRTNPRFGIEVARGTTVDYTLSLGPLPTPSPPPTPGPPGTPGPPATPTPLIPTQPPPTPEIIFITPGPPPTPEIIFITPQPPPPTAVPVTVGNYADCGTLGAAKALITDPEVGLVVGAIFPSTADDSWLVAGQYPASGTQVPPGTLVHLHVKDPVTETCP